MDRISHYRRERTEKLVNEVGVELTTYPEDLKKIKT